MIYGNYIGRNKYEVTHTLDGGNFSSVPWVSGLINGKGRYIDKTTGNEMYTYSIDFAQHQVREFIANFSIQKQVS